MYVVVKVILIYTQDRRFQISVGQPTYFSVQYISVQALFLTLQIIHISNIQTTLKYEN